MTQSCLVSWVILSAVCLTKSSILSQPIHADDNDWERPDLGAFSDKELAMILDELEQQERLQFIQLTPNQRRFGLNPGYKWNRELVPRPQYPEDIPSAPEAAVAEAVKAPEATHLSGSDEVAEDPFSEEPKDKKDSMYRQGSDSSTVLKVNQEKSLQDIYFTVIVACSSGLVAMMVVGIGVAYHTYMKKYKAAEEVEYPAYGVSGPGKDLSPTAADRKLAQNAQLYHYQHQKQQMIAFDPNVSAANRSNGIGSENDSEEEGEDNDYTVYECPGLAPTGEMEVRNPMFADESTPKSK